MVNINIFVFVSFGSSKQINKFVYMCDICFLKSTITSSLLFFLNYYKNINQKKCYTSFFINLLLANLYKSGLKRTYIIPVFITSTIIKPKSISSGKNGYFKNSILSIINVFFFIF